MEARHVTTVLDHLDGAGVRAWVFGGWGIDALLSEQSREHADLDLLVPSSEDAAALDALRPLGYDLVDDRRPRFYSVADQRDHVIDLHLMRLGPDGSAVVIRPYGSEAYRLRPHAFVSGCIAARPVPCISGEAQVLLHSGYERSREQRRDLRRLAERLGVPVPEYAL